MLSETSILILKHCGRKEFEKGSHRPVLRKNVFSMRQHFEGGGQHVLQGEGA